MFLEEQETERSNKTRQAECKLVEKGDTKLVVRPPETLQCRL